MMNAASAVAWAVLCCLAAGAHAGPAGSILAVQASSYIAKPLCCFFLDKDCKAPNWCWAKDAQQQSLHELPYTFSAAGAGQDYYSIRSYFTTKAQLCESTDVPQTVDLCGGPNPLKNNLAQRFEGTLVDVKGGLARTYNNVNLRFAGNNVLRIRGSGKAQVAFTNSRFDFTGVNWLDVISSRVLISGSVFRSQQFLLQWLQDSTLTFRQSQVVYTDAMLAVFNSALELDATKMVVERSKAGVHGPDPFLSSTKPAVSVSKGSISAKSSSLVFKNMDKVYFKDSTLALDNSTLIVDGSDLVLFQSTLRLTNSVIHLRNGARLFLYKCKTVGDAYLNKGAVIKGVTLGDTLVELKKKTFSVKLTGQPPK